MTCKRVNPLFRRGTQFVRKQRYRARCVDVFLEDENASQVSRVVRVSKFEDLHALLMAYVHYL